MEEEDQKEMIAAGVDKTLYLCFGEYNQQGMVSYTIQALRLRDFGPHKVNIKQLGVYIIGQGLRPNMGIGAFGSKIVLAGGCESIYDGCKYRSCPSKDMYVFETEDPNEPIKDPCDVFNNSTLQRGKSCPLVAQHDGKLYVLSTLCLKTWARDPFRGGFEMFDPKVGKWATLPESPTFGYIRHSRWTSYVVVGSNIFVSTLCCPIYRFDMADPNHQWKQHNFTDCSEFPMPLDCQTLAVETRHGDWVLFTCKLEAHLIADDKDYPKDDNYDMFDDFHRHLLEWKGTSMSVCLMSKDLTSLKALEPLKLPHLDMLPRHVRNIEPMLVHLGAQTVCLILSADTRDGAMREKQIFSMMFEFEIVESRCALAFRNFYGPFKFTYDADGPSDSRTTRVGMLGAILL